MTGRLETAYQGELIKTIKRLMPGSIVLKNDSGYMQGIPDLSIFHKDRWATLEVKKSAHERFEPNQEWYVDQMNAMSYSAFIYPENEREILDELVEFLTSPRGRR